MTTEEGLNTQTPEEQAAEKVLRELAVFGTPSADEIFASLVTIYSRYGQRAMMRAVSIVLSESWGDFWKLSQTFQPIDDNGTFASLVYFNGEHETNLAEWYNRKNAEDGSSRSLPRNSI